MASSEWPKQPDPGWVNLKMYPPIIQAAVMALLDFENLRVDPIGYDISYYQEDLPRVVAEAIQPWGAL